MLVLTRKQQEKIQIGDDIVITVLKTKGKTVRIGIEAPSTLSVLRGELAVRIREEAEAAATPPKSPQPAPNETPLASTDASNPERNTKAPGAGNQWSDHSGDEPRVSLDRVPRSRVATVLPQMLGASSFGESSSTGRGPLRAMMDRRAGAAI